MKVEEVAHGFKAVTVRVGGFIKRPKRNYRVAITRAAASSFLLNLTVQYNSIYTVALGANKIQLGSISSIGTASFKFSNFLKSFFKDFINSLDCVTNTNLNQKTYFWKMLLIYINQPRRLIYLGKFINHFTYLSRKCFVV